MADDNDFAAFAEVWNGLSKVTAYSMVLGDDLTWREYRNGELVSETPPRLAKSWERISTEESCRVYWGSHGCHRKKGHDGWCLCCEPIAYEGDEDEWECYVGGFPYYGPSTKFYAAGEDTEDCERMQAKLDAVAKLPHEEHEAMVLAEREVIKRMWAEP